MSLFNVWKKSINEMPRLTLKVYSRTLLICEKDASKRSKMFGTCPDPDADV
jgi:hypothetical protein